MGAQVADHVGLRLLSKPGAYEDSINAARRYITLHPGSPDAAYAQFLIGSSLFRPDPRRHRATRTAPRGRSARSTRWSRKYPDSEYAVAAKKKIEVARDQLAGKEMVVGRYYMDRRDFTGAINRFKVVVTHYQTTRHVEEALLRLTEAYMALGIVSEAQTSAAVLGHNFPDSRWYKDAYALVKAARARAEREQGVLDQPGFQEARRRLNAARSRRRGIRQTTQRRQP